MMQDAGYTIRKSSLPMNHAPYCFEHEAHEAIRRGTPPWLPPQTNFSVAPQPRNENASATMRILAVDC